MYMFYFAQPRVLRGAVADGGGGVDGGGGGGRGWRQEVGSGVREMHRSLSSEGCLNVGGSGLACGAAVTFL